MKVLAMRLWMLGLMGVVASVASSARADELLEPVLESPIQTYDLPTDTEEAAPVQTTRCNDRPAPGSFTYNLMTVVESDALPNVVIRFYALNNPQGDIIGMMTYRSDQSVAKVYGLCDIRQGNVKVHQNGDSGRLVTQIQSVGFTGQHGGTVTLMHLYNGANGVYRSVTFDVAREGANWRLYWDHSEPHTRSSMFNYIYMHGRRVFIIGLVGISHLTPELLNDQEMRQYASRPLPLPRR